MKVILIFKQQRSQSANPEVTDSNIDVSPLYVWRGILYKFLLRTLSFVYTKTNRKYNRVEHNS